MKRLATVWAAMMILVPAGTATAGGGTSTGDETTGGQCEICPPGTSTGDIVFGDLDHGRPPAGETVVEVSAEPKCRCSDCACYDDVASQIRLELDGEPVGAPCPGSQCEFIVVLTTGPHALTAIASYGFGDVSAEVQLVVPSEGGSTETGAPIDDDDGTHGCGCTSSCTPDPFALLPIVGAFARRRRARPFTRPEPPQNVHFEALEAVHSARNCTHVYFAARERSHEISEGAPGAVTCASAAR